MKRSEFEYQSWYNQPILFELTIVDTRFINPHHIKIAKDNLKYVYNVLS